MNRAYYRESIENFHTEDADRIFGRIAKENPFDLNTQQKEAWISQTELLKKALIGLQGTLYFEFSIPRMGKRIDAVILIGPVIFLIEFKVGEKLFNSQDIEQVMDYALDMANFHEGSHSQFVVPILVATEASDTKVSSALKLSKDKIFEPLKSNAKSLPRFLKSALAEATGNNLEFAAWESSGYKPTPTIIEAGIALYASHSVVDIARSDAGARNLALTSKTVLEVIESAKGKKEKAICFVTGVPGAGKTLVGLDIATKHMKKDEFHSTFLSGNWPLVTVLQEALARDKVRRAKEKGEKIRKKEAHSDVKAFIQIIHHFRDEGLIDEVKAPSEHVVIFDEAQRAWDLEQTKSFMKRKKDKPNFKWSEPEFLISCMNRHKDWAVIVCLVGGGQEINTGEAGITEWIAALNRSFRDWKVYVSDKLNDAEFGAEETRAALGRRNNVSYVPELHLKTSMRSFRSEKVSAFVKQLLDQDKDEAQETLKTISKEYPIFLTRDLNAAKAWLKKQARGSERYGILASSKATRLRPHALDVKAKASPVHWFLNGKDDVRSSFFMEDVATEFDVQGLELDWACVAWDADFRYKDDLWETFEFTAVPNKPLMRWNNIKKAERKIYLKNAYRVLLTRARQGMVVLIPEGVREDATRQPEYYDTTFRYLVSLGLQTL